MNYFSLFGLEVSYQIDVTKLASRFRNLQYQYHPDNFVSSSQDEQLIAIKRSAAINQAWQTLRNPLNRAEYLLSLYGINVINRCICNTEFLEEQFSLREQLDEIKQIKDKKQLKTFIQQVKNIFDLHCQKMTIELDNKNWENAANTVYKLRFLNELHNSAEQIEEKINYF